MTDSTTLGRGTSPVRPGRADGPPTRPTREPFWDNVRWIAIALVVIGHTIEPPSRNDLAFGIYLAIYAFHMPLFAFVAGRFARAEPFDRRQAAQLIRQLIAPYVVFQVVWSLLNLAFTGRFVVNFAYPIWLLWFLVALVIWRLTLPLFAATRFPVTIAVLISCASGYWSGLVNLWAAPRTLTFLPFFVAGWALHRSGWLERFRDAARRPVFRLLSAGVLTAVVVLAVLGSDLARDLQLRKLVQGEWALARMGYPQWWAGSLRLAAIAAALVLIGCVLALVPRVDGPVARAGQRTMTIYLLHLLPLVALQRAELFPDRVGTLGVLALLAIGLLWAVLLSTPMVHTLASPFVSPRVDWLLDRQIRGSVTRRRTPRTGRAVTSDPHAR